MMNEKVYKQLKEMKQQLTTITDGIFDDGADRGDYSQNMNYNHQCRTIENIGDELALMKVDGLDDEELDKMWVDSWGKHSHSHLPEAECNHHIRYIAALIEYIEKQN